LAHQRSDPPREIADKRAEVLSDSTDLDALLAAILGDERAPASVEARPRQAVDARPEPVVVARTEAPLVARPVPTLVAPPRVAIEPDWNSDRPAVTDDDGAAWADLKEFLVTVRQQDVRAADQKGAAAESAFSPESAFVIASPVPSRNWREMIAVPTSRRALLVVGLSAAALIALIAIISLRDDQDNPVVPPSPAAEVPTLVPSASTVEPPSNAPPPVAAEVDVTAPARETTAKPRVITPPSPTRANEPTDPVRSEVQPRALPSPTGAAVVAPPTVGQRVVDEAVPAPTRAAIPDSDPPKPASSTPAPAAATAPTVAGGAEPVAPAPVAPVPASVARTPPRLLTGGAPEYPAALRTARVGGIVEVRFTIDAKGQVVNVQSVAGPPQLRPAAEAAVRRWRYEPARLGNVAVDTQTSVTFNFDPSTSRRPQD
jgi:periplasmic protein TonB